MELATQAISRKILSRPHTASSGSEEKRVSEGTHLVMVPWSVMQATPKMQSLTTK